MPERAAASSSGRGSRLEPIERLVRASAGSRRARRVLPTAEVARGARRFDRARPSLALRGARPRRDRGVLPRPRRRRQLERRHPDLVDDGENGLLVDAEDVDGLADALVRVLVGPGARRAVSAKRRSAGTRSWHLDAARSSPRAMPRRSSTPGSTVDFPRESRARQAAREERRLPHDRRDGDHARRRRTEPPTGRCACSCTTRSTTSPRTRVTVPTAVSTSRWRSSRELGYTVVGLDAVLDHYVDGARAAAEGRPDHVRRRLPRQPRERAARAPAARLPGGALRRRSATSATRRPLPHEEHLVAARDPQPHARLGRAARARAGRRPDRVARDLAPAARGARGRRGGARDRDLEAPARGAARPAGARVRVRQGLGGALPARPPEPAPPGGLRPRLHVRLRGERPGERPLPAAALQRRAVSARARSSSCSRAPAT